MLPRIAIDMAKIEDEIDGNKELYGYDSEIKNYAYVTDNKDVIIYSSRNGYIRVSGDRLKTLIRELTEVAEDMNFRRTVH